MEVNLTPDAQAKLDQMARESGVPSDHLVADAIIAHFDELAYTRATLDRRFDELEQGTVRGIDGEEAYRQLLERTMAQRHHRRSP